MVHQPLRNKIILLWFFFSDLNTNVQISLENRKQLLEQAVQTEETSTARLGP